MKRCRSFKFVVVCSLMLFGTGCGGGGKTPADPHAGHDHSKDDHSGHDHAQEGPHHGQLIVLGKEEFHLELTDDSKTHTVAVYVLDKSGKANVPIDAQELKINLVVDGKPVQFSLPAAAQKDDPAGKSSCFQLVDEKLCSALDAKDVKGHINLTIAEKPYVGNLKSHSHSEHKH